MEYIDRGHDLSNNELSHQFISGLRNLPATNDKVLDFKNGWITSRNDNIVPYLSYAEQDEECGWSDSHEKIHEESSRTHFIDLYTRKTVRTIIQNYFGLKDDHIICDLGCSTGYLLEDVSRIVPKALLIGADLVVSGLIKLNILMPEIMLFQINICDIPFSTDSIDVVISLNVLEHIADDVQALREIYRILKPNGVACIVVPVGSNLYDYYDEILLHKRRYGRKELVQKAKEIGFSVIY